MKKELLMGNEAVAMGALAAGVGVVAGYPGTPSSEVLETVAARNPGNVYVEWSTNEKAAMEVAAGAAYCGVRAMVTMKQVGLNVASDPLMSLNYVGVKGGMVVYVADDPGPISSQTEQDTRHYGQFAKIPVLDPSSPSEAYDMVQEAFELSETYEMPVILRGTTRICHGCEAVEVDTEKIEAGKDNERLAAFEKNSKWVIFPKLSYENKKKILRRQAELKDVFAACRFNSIAGSGRTGIACGGISCGYVAEAVRDLGEENFTIFKCGTPYPFPETKALEFMNQVDRIIVFEELDPVIEDSLIMMCGKYHLTVPVHGKGDGTVLDDGELSYQAVKESISRIEGSGAGAELPDCRVDRWADRPEIPVRPPVLCAGCPHRASFYAVKKAMSGRRAVFSGDIGCYTLGNAMPLDMVDTCLCMGAGVTIPQGIGHSGEDTVNFGFVGDSTFFASGITGVINAVYNQANMVLVVLDNSTTAMTGHQPHPGTGLTMMGHHGEGCDIKKILEAIGLTRVEEVDPLDYELAVSTVREIADLPGVKAVIFKSPCAARIKKRSAAMVDTDKCTGCRYCISQLGCPALSIEGNRAVIDETLCMDCGLCGRICPRKCIYSGGEAGEVQ